MNKIRLKWLEPRAVRKVLDAQERNKVPRPPDFRPLIVVGFAANLLVNGLIKRIGSEYDPPSILWVTLVLLAVALFVVYVIPWLRGFIPATIFLLENELEWSSGAYRKAGRLSLLPVASCEIADVATPSGRFPVLKLCRREGDCDCFGVDPDVKDELAALLRGMKLEVRD